MNEDTFWLCMMGRMTIAECFFDRMHPSKQPLSKERSIPRRGWSACTAGCLLGGSARSSSRLAEKTPWDAPPVPSSVEECPAHSDVRGSAAPRGQIRGSRPGRVSASKREVIG